MMTTHAYDEIYLPDVKWNLGAIFDAAACRRKGYEKISREFENSKISRGIEIGAPQYLCGMSATEMLSEILHKHLRGLKYPTAQSPEFWAGSILAHLQWDLNRPFKDIFRVIPFKKIVTMYDSCHEKNDDAVVSELANEYFTHYCYIIHIEKKINTAIAMTDEILRKNMLVNTDEYSCRTLACYSHEVKLIKQKNAQNESRIDDFITRHTEYKISSKTASIVLSKAKRDTTCLCKKPQLDNPCDAERWISHGMVRPMD